MALEAAEQVDLRFFQRGNKVWVRNPYKPGDERCVAARCGGGSEIVQGAPRRRDAPTQLWVPGEVLTVSAGDGAPEISVQTSLPPRVPLIVPAREVLPMNQITGLDQMSEFSHLHDAAVLYNVQRRYLEERPYTQAGSLLLAVNPHRVITDRDGISIYDPIYMHRYRMRMPEKFKAAMPTAGKAAVTLPPHIYDTVEGAIDSLRSNVLPQALVLSGESGSGKSETAKLVSAYLMHSSVASRVALEQRQEAAEAAARGEEVRGAAESEAASRGMLSPTRTTSARLRLRQGDLVAARRDAASRRGAIGGPRNAPYHKDLGPVELRALAGEAVIEAFSSAGTHANANASRAIRVTKYHFHPNGTLVAAAHTVFLTDVARVTQVPFVPGADWRAGVSGGGFKGFAPHTNFHVFYYLLAGAPAELRSSLRFGNGDASAGVQVADAPIGYRYLRPVAPDDDANAQQRTLASGGASQTDIDRITGQGVATLSSDHAFGFTALVHHLSKAGIEGEAQSNLWHVLAGILHLGNITFTLDAGEGGGVTANIQAVERAASVLGVTREELMAEVTSRPTGAAGTSRVRIKTIAEAMANVDNTARRLYTRLFNWLVAQINAAAIGSAGEAWQVAAEAVPELDLAAGGLGAAMLAPEAGAPKEPLYVAVYDTPGFEMLPKGGVEGGSHHGLAELFGNHIAERLHAEFVDRVFKAEQRVYESERIDGRHIQYSENKDVLACLENPRTGLLMMLEEQSAHRRATDASLLHKLHTMQKRNPAYAKPPNRVVAQTFFALRHTAAAVTYSIDGTLNVNRVQVQDSICAALASSSFRPLVALLGSTSSVTALLGKEGGEGAAAPSAEGGPSASPGSVASPARGGGRRGGALGAAAVDKFWGSAFSQTLDTLLAALRGCEVHFVFCLRPNVLSAPNYVEPALLHHQMVYGNVMHAVALRHSGFSYRTIFEDFYARFIIIAQQSGNLVYPPPPHANMRALCKELLQQLVTHPVFEAVDVARSAQLGVTKIFLRKHMIDTLNALREVRMKAMDRMATKAQAMWKGAHTRLRLRQMWAGMEELQVTWRAHMHRAAWLRRLWAARRIQHAVRGWRATRRWDVIRSNIKKLQGWYKSGATRRRFKRTQNSLRLLHTLARGYIVRQHVLAMLENVVKLQTVARDFLVRNANYHRKARAAARIQAAWRGFTWRWKAEDVLEYLALRRMDRHMDKAAAKLQAFWRGLLVWRRFNQIRNAATTIQRYWRSRRERDIFLRLQSAVRAAQAFARAYLQHRRQQREANLRGLADELWRLQALREREAQDLVEAHGVEAVCGVSSMRALVQQGTRGTHILGSLLDVDCALDVSDIYSTGFVRMYDELVTSLTDAGHRVAGIAVGGTHVMVLTDHGVVYSWGFADRGQCGHSDWEPSWSPRRVETLATGAQPEYVLQALEVGYRAAKAAAVRSKARISEGGDAAFESVRTDGGGKAGDRPPRALASASAYAGLLGSSSVTTPLGLLGVSGGVPEPGMSTPFTLGGVKRALKNGIAIRQIAAGEEHSLALSTSGAVFAWGEGRRGQLGLGGKVPVNTPTPVAALARKVSSITAGSNHSAALLSTGTVMVWGAGPALGIWSQPGVEGAAARRGSTGRGSPGRGGEASGPDLTFMRPWLAAPPTSSAEWAELLATLPDMPVPQPVRGLRFDRDRVRHLEAGGSVTAATTAEGRVYTWGVSKVGALGHGDTDPRLVPTLVRALLPPAPSRSASPPKAPVETGASISEGKADPAGTQDALPSTPGREGAGGEGGRGGSPGSPSRAKAAHFRINMTAVGGSHCVAVAATGKVYVWGANGSGQLGLGDTAPQLLPTPLTTLRLRRVLQAVAGTRSTHVLTDLNEVLAWGAAGSLRSPIASTAWSEDAGEDAEEGPGTPRRDPKRKNTGDVVNTVFRSLVPLEVPFHDVPSRVPKRLLVGHSRSMGVVGIVYSQSPLSDGQAHSVLFGLHKSSATPADPLQLSLTAAQASAAHEAELIHSAATGAVDAAELLATASRSTRRLRQAARLVAEAESRSSSPGKDDASVATAGKSSVGGGGLTYGETSMITPGLVSMDARQDLLAAIEAEELERLQVMEARALGRPHAATDQHPELVPSSGDVLRNGHIRSVLDDSVGPPVSAHQLRSLLPHMSPRVAAALLGGLTPARVGKITNPQLYVLVMRLKSHLDTVGAAPATGKLPVAAGRASIVGWGVSSTPGVSVVSGQADNGKPKLAIVERKRRKYRSILAALEHTSATSKASAQVAERASANGVDPRAATYSANARRRAQLRSKAPGVDPDAGSSKTTLAAFSHARSGPALGPRSSPGTMTPEDIRRSQEAGWTANFAASAARKGARDGIASPGQLHSRGTGTYVGARGGAPASPNRPVRGKMQSGAGLPAGQAVDMGTSSGRAGLRAFHHAKEAESGELTNVAAALAVATGGDSLASQEAGAASPRRTPSPGRRVDRSRRAVRGSMPNLAPMTFKGYELSPEGPSDRPASPPRGARMGSKPRPVVPEAEAAAAKAAAEAEAAAKAEAAAAARLAREGRVQRRASSGASALHALFSPAHLVATSNDDMEYQDVVAAYHKRAAQASAAKAHAATARTSPGRTPKRSFGDDATRTTRRLDRMMAMGAGGGAAPAPVAEGDSPGASPAATSPAGAGGDAGHLSSGRVVNRRASEVRAAFPRAMGHQSAADAASPGSGRMSTPSFTSPPSKPDLGGGGRVTVRGLVSGTAPPQGKTPSPGAQRGTPGRQPPPTPDAGVDAPSLEPRPAGPAAEAAAAARAATSRALAEADAQAGESPSSSAPAAPGKAQASVEDIKGAAAAEAAALWEAGESKGPASPLPSLNQLLAGQRQ